MRLETNISFAARTSLGVGGQAKYWVTPDGIDELPEVQWLAGKLSVPIVVMGSGTNVLAADTMDDVMVVQYHPPSSLKGPVLRSVILEGDSTVVEVEAHIPWDDFVRAVVVLNCPGIECLSGIPGTVGAAPVQNVGAYGQEVATTLERVTVFDFQTGLDRPMEKAECNFGYRSSIFNRPENLDRFVITFLRFKFNMGIRPCRVHPEVSKGTKVLDSLFAVRTHVLQLRSRKGMLAGQQFSAGSFFKNPVVPAPVFDKTFDLDAIMKGVEIWWKPRSEGVQISAAWLIEKAGFTKGSSRARAGISPLHALALQNLGGAISADFIYFAREIQERVVEQFNIVLQPEVRLIGFRDYPLFK